MGQPDSSNRLQQTAEITSTQLGVLVFLLSVTMKVCELPATVSSFAMSKAVWVVLILLVLDFGCLFFVLKVAKQGGLFNMELPRAVKVSIFAVLLSFFFFKMIMFTRGVANFFVMVLFENISLPPLYLIILTAISVGASKNFAGISRVAEIFSWLGIVVFLFFMVFTEVEGNIFNLLAVFNPDTKGMGTGLLRSVSWFGDFTPLLLVDLRNEDPAKKKKTPIIVAVILSFIVVIGFYVLFIAQYGEITSITKQAFVKLTNYRSSTEELGSSDWPISILWSVMACFYLAIYFAAGKECICGIIGKELQGPKINFGCFVPFTLICLVMGGVTIGMESHYRKIMSSNIVFFVIGIFAMSIALGIIAIMKEKKKGGQEKI